MKSIGNSQRHSLRRSPLTPSTTTLLNRNGSSPIDFASAGVPSGLLHSLPHSHSSVYQSFKDKNHQPQSNRFSKFSSTNSDKKRSEEERTLPKEDSQVTNSEASPTLSTSSASKNVYATIVRQLDSSPSAIRRSFHFQHQPKFPLTNRSLHQAISRPLKVQSPQPSLSTNTDESVFNSNNNHNNNQTSYSRNNSSNIHETTFDSASISNIIGNTSQINSSSITKTQQFNSSNGDNTHYSTLQYSPSTPSREQSHNSSINSSNNAQQAQAGSLKTLKMNSKRYSMDVQDFIHRPSASSTSESSSAMETISSGGGNDGLNDSTNNNKRLISNGNGYNTHDNVDNNGNRFHNNKTGDSPQEYFTIEQGQYLTLDNSVNQTNGSNSSTASRQICDKYGFFIDENANIERQPRKVFSAAEMKCIRDREAKWIQMLNNWKYCINYKWDKIRDRCRKGIPHSLRSQAWFYLCGGHLQKRRYPRKFQELLTQKVPDDVRNEIQKDLHRQFPSHEMFAERGGTGQTDLFNVLKAFAVYKPKIGYCQAQGPIAAVLLMHMPAEHAFWSLVSLNDYYIGGYFLHNLEEIQIQGKMLFAYLKKFSPSAYNLLKRQNIDPILYMTEWFMCIYSRTLSWPSVLRVWDMFLCEGVSVLFKVGIYLVDVSLRGENTKSCPTMYETCQKLRQIPEHYLKEENLVKGLKSISLKDTDVVREHKIQLKRFRKQKTTEVR